MTKKDTTADKYNRYYKPPADQEGETSLYNKKFGNRLFTTKEVNLIKEVVDLAVKKNEKAFERLRAEGSQVPTITLLDFGCGDGRFFDVFRENKCFCTFFSRSKIF